MSNRARSKVKRDALAAVDRLIEEFGLDGTKSWSELSVSLFWAISVQEANDEKDPVRQEANARILAPFKRKPDEEEEEEEQNEIESESDGIPDEDTVVCFECRRRVSECHVSNCQECDRCWCESCYDQKKEGDITPCKICKRSKAKRQKTAE